MWAYEEYSEWSRLLAQSSASDAELACRLAKAEKATAKAKESHFNAVSRTSSMQGQSARRASTRTSMVASYEEANALRDALELRRVFPRQALSEGENHG